MISPQTIGNRPTPFYAYDIALLNKTLDAMEDARGDFHVHYAIKANSNQQIIREIAARGLGADCVSGGEIQRAVDCGINPTKIVFAGVGKTDNEINLALSLGIGCFNVESEDELRVISQLAAQRNVVAPIAIRVNPNVDAHTHANITTGLAENKFGINLELLPPLVCLARQLPAIKLTGLHFHIGSQMLEYEPLEALCKVVNRLNDEISGLTSINLGGGLGIDYANPDAHPIPDFAGFFKAYRRNLRLRPEQEVHFELGRSIVAQCGSLISRVTYVKKGTHKTFVICDTGMSDLIRPALYDAHHVVQNLSAAPSAPIRHYDVVGPICESSDVFGTDESLPETHRGDILAFRSAGAYGEIMASHYNLRTLHSPLYY